MDIMYDFMVTGLLRVLVITGQMAIGNIIMTDMFGLQEVGKADDSNSYFWKKLLRFCRAGYPHLFKISYVKTAYLHK